MKKHLTKATIFAVDKLGSKYPVCYLEQIYYEDDGFEYIFKPHYNIIDLLDSEVFQGIPGLNLDLRKESYIRKNSIPTFIYERTPQKNREDLWELLGEVGLDSLNHLEWLLRTDKVYTGDNLIVEAYIEPQVHRHPDQANYGDRFILEDMAEGFTNLDAFIKFLHEVTIKGASLEADDFFINEDNRKFSFALMHLMYEDAVTQKKKAQQAGINKAKKAGKYTGRKRIPVSIPLLHEVIQRREQGEISLEEAMNELGIKSKSTFYRRVKEFKERY